VDNKNYCQPATLKKVAQNTENMYRKLKKLLPSLPAIIISLISMQAIYAQEENIPKNGELSDEIKWNIENDTLFLSGSGVIPTTMFGARSAWHYSRSIFSAIVIEEGITDVGKNIFNGYKNIKSITISKTVKSIDANSFSLCKNLVSVEVKSIIPPDINYATFALSKLKKATLIVPKGTKSAYLSDPLWNMFGTIEENANSEYSEEMLAEVNATIDPPCTIYLSRSSNFLGKSASLSVFLNGIEQEKLNNASTVVFKTSKLKNTLLIMQGKSRSVIRRFDAKPGGEIHLDFSYFLGLIKVEE
jgi:hypothetical protein